jgi:predicted RNase H-related nuclease YkuK (DUF458 family)
MEIRKRFKKFGGEYIPDIVEYLKEYIAKDPAVTISLGCDSIQRRRKTVYAITLMLYNTDIKNGAHVVFFRENVNKIRDNESRLRKEAEYVQEIGDFLHNELQGFYVRKDLSLLERRKYKFHVAKCNGQYSHVSYNEDTVVENMTLTDHEKVEDFKLIDLHLDFNPVEERRVKKANGVEGESIAKNKSNLSYKIYVPMLRGMGYRVWSKPSATAATSAADLLLQD